MDYIFSSILKEFFLYTPECFLIITSSVFGLYACPGWLFSRGLEETELSQLFEFKLPYLYSIAILLSHNPFHGFAILSSLNL